MIRSNTEGEESANYFKIVKIKIMFHELNIEKAKQILIKHFCTNSSALYTEHDSDFEIIPQVMTKKLSLNLMKLLLATTKNYCSQVLKKW